MADINISQLNPSALAALAGQRVGNLNLPATGVQPGLFNQAYVNQRNTMANQALQQQDIQMRLQVATLMEKGMDQRTAETLVAQAQQQQSGQQFTSQQNQLQRQQQTTQFAQQQQLAQQQLAEQSQYHTGSLGIQQQQNLIAAQQAQNQATYQQGELGLGQQNADTARFSEGIKALAQQNTLNIEKQGAFSTWSSLLLNEAKTPEEAQKLLHDVILPTGLKEGILNQDQATEYANMDPKQVAQLGALHTIAAGMAGVIKGGMAGGGGLIPSTQNIFGNQNMVDKNKADTQESIGSQQRALVDVGTTLANFNPELFTGIGATESAAGSVAGKYPIIQDIGNVVSPDTTKKSLDLANQQSAFEGNVLQSIADTLNQQKGARFNAPAFEILKPEIPHIGVGPGSDSPGTAFTKLITLHNRMNRALELEGTAAAQGVDLNSDNFKQQVIQTLSSGPSATTVRVVIPDGHLKGKTVDWSWNDIEDYAKSQNMKPADFWKNEVMPNVKW